jgi:hypothetical protein
MQKTYINVFGQRCAFWHSKLHINDEQNCPFRCLKVNETKHTTYRPRMEIDLKEPIHEEITEDKNERIAESKHNAT